MNDKHHEMVLKKTHNCGVEEWHCPTCGRRFLVQWPPAYKMIILVQGEQDIRHNLSLGKARSAMQAESVIEESRLIPWLKWFETVNFDPRWGKTT